MSETIPKLRDQRQTFRVRQTSDLVRSEQFHAFQINEKEDRGTRLNETRSASAGRFAFDHEGLMLLKNSL